MSKSILIDMLEKSKKEQQIIGIRKYGDGDAFWSGYVIDFNEELIQLQHFTKYGKPDGIIIELVSTIESIDFDDDYSKAMKYIIENNSLLDKQSNQTLKLNDSEDWQLETLQQLEGNKDVLVSVEMNNEQYYTGFLLVVSETDFVMNCIGKMGENEDKVIYRIEDVTAIRINDMDDRKRKMLYDWRKNGMKAT